MNPFKAVRDTVAGFCGALAAMWTGPPPTAQGPPRITNEGYEGYEDGTDESDTPYVSFSVGKLRIVSHSHRLTPDDILRAAGYNPARDRPVLACFLSEAHADPSWVYAQADFNTAIHVDDGAHFEVWHEYDQRLHSYEINLVRYVGLEYALPPAEVLRRAGCDPKKHHLINVYEGGVEPIRQDHRPIRVSGMVFRIGTNS